MLTGFDRPSRICFTMPSNSRSPAGKFGWAVLRRAACSRSALRMPGSVWIPTCWPSSSDRSTGCVRPWTDSTKAPDLGCLLQRRSSTYMADVSISPVKSAQAPRSPSNSLSKRSSSARRRDMKRLLPLLLCALPAPALAQIDYGASGYIDLRLVSPADQASWLQGGLGKTRYGRGDSDFQFAGIVGQGYVLLTPEILAVSVLRIEPEQRTLVDLLESYVRYRPVSTSPWRWSVKGGAFFAPFSLEITELGWSSYWTITPSAINSWFGEELRTLGGEGTLDWRAPEGTLEFIAAGFGWNDPAGVMVADRGWTLSDRPTGLIDHLRLPNATLILLGQQPPDSTPIFQEYDGNAGWYVGAS